MTVNWGGAQWVLATILVLATVVGPPLRLTLINQGMPQKKTWKEFWGGWIGDLFMRAGLVAILAWGGFWK